MIKRERTAFFKNENQLLAWECAGGEKGELLPVLSVITSIPSVVLPFTPSADRLTVVSVSLTGGVNGSGGEECRRGLPARAR